MREYLRDALDQDGPPPAVGGLPWLPSQFREISAADVGASPRQPAEPSGGKPAAADAPEADASPDLHT